MFLVENIAQGLYTPYLFPSKTPESYRINADSAYKLNVLTTKKAISDYKQNCDFAEMVCYSKKNRFLGGKIYYNWFELEEYLNKVLQGILPDSLKSFKNIHAYVARDYDYNAYAAFDGSLYFNIGFLADLENETELAAVLGHEITHYVQKDVLNSFIYSLNNNRKNKDRLKVAEYERSLEQLADSIGFTYAIKANYNLKTNYAFLDKLYFEEYLSDLFYSRKGVFTVGSKKDSIRLRNSQEYRNSLKDHPRAKSRKELLQVVLLNEKKTGELSYVFANEPEFLRLRKKARLETLHLLMLGNEYYQCMVKAFTYYIQEPEDEAYYYYLIESLRKYILINGNEELNRGFLNNHLRTVLKYTDCILKDISLLSTDTSFKDKIKVKQLIDNKNLPFNNYYQAIDFFLELGYEKKFVSALYTSALYYYNDDEKRNYFSDEYLKQKDIKSSDFIVHLKQKKLINSLENNSIEKLFVGKIKILQDKAVNPKTEYIEAEKLSADCYKEISSGFSKKFPNKIIVNETEDLNINDVLFYYHLNSSSEINLNNSSRKHKEKYSKTIYFNDDSLDITNENLLERLFLLEPDIWEYFHKNKLKQIDIVYPSYYRQEKYVAGSFSASKHQIFSLYNLNLIMSKEGSIKSNTFSIYTSELDKKFIVDKIIKELKGNP